MRKSIFILSLLAVCLSAAAFGQSSMSASQTIQLQLNPIIEIDASAASVNISNKSTTATSPQFNVRSNKDFIVSVNTATVNNEEKVSARPIADILSLSLINNDASGKTSYKVLTANSQDILSGKHGKDNVFAVNYKTRHTKNANDINVGVIYTATQP